jgi:hypothetical protein
VPAPAAHAETNKVVSGSECADVTIIAIGGSNTNDITTDTHGLQNEDGEDVPRVESMENKVAAYAAEAIRSALPDNKSVKFVDVKYSPVDEYIGFGGTLHAQPPEYKAAVMGGSKSFIDAAHKVASECGSSSLVFIGFGQGAGAIRVSLEHLNDDTKNKTKAVWFMSDSMHDGSGGDGFQYYDSYTGWDQRVNGFMRLSKAFFDADDAAESTGGEPKEVLLRDKIAAPLEHSIPAEMKINIVSMCDGKDGFCSPSEDTNIMIDSNASQYITKSYLSEGSRWVIERINGNKEYVVGNARGEITNGTVVHRGNGATWVVENVQEPAVVTKCISDYAVIGVRGSGENIDGGVGENTTSTTGENGVTTEAMVITKGGMPSQEDAIRMKDFSDILATAAWGIKTNLPEGSTIRFIPVLYEAQAVEEIYKAPDMYANSINSGKDKAKDMVKKVADLCPNTQILLMGYSQGALSSHLAINELDRVYRDKISAAYLIADPIRDKTDPSVQLYFDEDSGDSFAQTDESNLFSSNGIARRLNMYTEKVGHDMNAKIIEVCHTEDPVCNSRQDEQERPAWAYYGKGLTEVHPSIYKEESQFWGFPTQWASSKLIRARVSSVLPRSAVADSEFLYLENGKYTSPFFGMEGSAANNKTPIGPIK